MARFSEEYQFLLNNYCEILLILSKDFDSGDFITAFQRKYPNEYASAINKCNSYRIFHSWVARWFLIDLKTKGILIKRESKSRLSVNRNKTKNHYWSKVL